MAQYEKDTAEIQRAIEQWDSLHGGNPDYEACLKIVDHLRADVESYVRREFVPPVSRLPWRFLPPGHRDVSWVVDEIGRLKSQYPHLRFDEERLRYAYSLQPSDVFTGEDEFDGYFAFVFANTGHVLLENPQEGNAAYIFQQDWTSLSKRTKQELLSSHAHCVKACSTARILIGSGTYGTVLACEPLQRRQVRHGQLLAFIVRRRPLGGTVKSGISRDALGQFESKDQTGELIFVAVHIAGKHSRV